LLNDILFSRAVILLLFQFIIYLHKKKGIGELYAKGDMTSYGTKKGRELKA